MYSIWKGLVDDEVEARINFRNILDKMIETWSEAKIARLRPAATAIVNFCTLYDTCYINIITLNSLHFISQIA